MNKQEFTQIMQRLESQFPSAVPSYSEYWRAMIEFDAENVDAAVTNIIRTREKTTFPRLAELLASVNRTAGRFDVQPNQPTGILERQVENMEYWNRHGYRPPFTRQEIDAAKKIAADVARMGVVNWQNEQMRAQQVDSNALAGGMRL